MRKEVREAIRELCLRTKDIRNGNYKNNIKGGNNYDKAIKCQRIRKML